MSLTDYDCILGKKGTASTVELLVGRASQSEEGCHWWLLCYSCQALDNCSKLFRMLVYLIIPEALVPVRLHGSDRTFVVPDNTAGVIEIFSRPEVYVGNFSRVSGFESRRFAEMQPPPIELVSRHWGRGRGSIIPSIIFWIRRRST